jgi:hypothetical protein
MASNGVSDTGLRFGMKGELFHVALAQRLERGHIGERGVCTKQEAV